MWSSYSENLSSVLRVELLRKESLMLLDLISLLDPDAIKESVLQQFGQISSLDYPQTRIAYIEARTELLRSSLIRRDISRTHPARHQ